MEPSLEKLVAVQLQPDVNGALGVVLALASDVDLRPPPLRAAGLGAGFPSGATSEARLQQIPAISNAMVCCPSHRVVRARQR